MPVDADMDVGVSTADGIAEGAVVATEFSVLLSDGSGRLRGGSTVLVDVSAAVRSSSDNITSS